MRGNRGSKTATDRLEKNGSQKIPAPPKKKSFQTTKDKKTDLFRELPKDIYLHYGCMISERQAAAIVSDMPSETEHPG